MNCSISLLQLLFWVKCILVFTFVFCFFDCFCLCIASVTAESLHCSVFLLHLFYIWVFLVLHHFPICSVRPFMMRLSLLAIVVFQQDMLHSNHSLNHFDCFYVRIKAEMKVKVRSNWFPRTNWGKGKLVILGNSVLNSEHGGFSAILWLKRKKWLVFEEKKPTTTKRTLLLTFITSCLDLS